MTSKDVKTKRKTRSQRPNRDAIPVSPHPGISASEALLSQTFLELAPDAMLVIDTAGHIVQLNHQTEVLFGYPRAKLLGQPIQHLLPERFHSAHLRHRTAYVAEPQTRPMGTNLPLFGSATGRAKFPVEVSLSPVHIGDELLVISSIRDMTERRRLEAVERAAHAAAERQRLLLQTLLDQLPGGAYLVRGPDAELVLVNRAAEQVWGATWARGQTMAEFLRASGLRYFSETGEPLTVENLYTTQILHGTDRGPPASPGHSASGRILSSNPAECGESSTPHCSMSQAVSQTMSRTVTMLKRQRPPWANPRVRPWCSSRISAPSRQQRN